MRIPNEVYLILGLVAAILLAAVVGFAETPESYARKVERSLEAAEKQLEEFKRAAGPSGAGFFADSIYEVRAEMDIELCRVALRAYRAGKADRGAVRLRVHILSRDLEDYPPQEAQGMNCFAAGTLAEIDAKQPPCEETRK